MLFRGQKFSRGFVSANYYTVNGVNLSFSVIGVDELVVEVLTYE